MEPQDTLVRTAMNGRLLRCPLGGNPADCPLHDIRLLPMEERLKWLDLKTDFELAGLFSSHIQCLKKKQGSFVCHR